MKTSYGLLAAQNEDDTTRSKRKAMPLGQRSLKAEDDAAGSKVTAESAI